MQLHQFDALPRQNAEIISTERLSGTATNEVRELVLDLTDEAQPFRVGQCIGIIAPPPPADAASTSEDQRLRLYSITDAHKLRPSGDIRVTIAVKRCFGVDPVSGAPIVGRVSNFLCDREAGETITVVGPLTAPYEVPADEDATVFLITTSGGIAPFRAFVQYLAEAALGFNGKVRLFRGSAAGLELVSIDEARREFAAFLDDRALAALTTLCTRPHWTDTIDWSAARSTPAKRLWKLLEHPRSYVTIAGLAAEHDGLIAAMTSLGETKEAFDRRRADMIAAGRWVELLWA